MTTKKHIKHNQEAIKSKMEEERMDDFWRNTILIFVIIFLGIAIMIAFKVDKNKEAWIEEGMMRAEGNCVKFICENTGKCTDIKIIDQIQDICKSYVRDTDFYLKYDDFFSKRDN